MAVPSAPTNCTASASWLGNVIAWDASAGALWYRLYFEYAATQIPSFNPIPGDWYIYKKNGAEVVTYSGGLNMFLPDAIDAQALITQYNANLPIYPDNFSMAIDLKDYDFSDGADQPNTRVAIYSTGLTNNYFLLEFEGDETHTLKMRVGWRINAGTYTTGSTVGTGSFLGIGYLPSAFKITRTGNTMAAYYEDFSDDWIPVWDKDFGAYASYLDTFRLSIDDKSLNGGRVIFGDMVMTPPPFGSTVYVESVSSPYLHTYPIIRSRHDHAYHVTAINSDGESNNSNIVMLRPWQHYFLGPDRTNAIELFPEWNFNDGEIAKIDTIRTDASILHMYKEYDYKEISFNAKHVPASEAVIVNSWWSTQTKLIWFTELGSVTIVDSIMIGNNAEPFIQYSRGYCDHYDGKIVLEEYV
jgi:hypothetical protein